MPSAVDAQTAPSDATGAAPPPPDSNLHEDEDAANEGNLYDDAVKEEGNEDGNEDRNANGAADFVDMQEATVAGKKKKKTRSVAARGPTALPKRCGTGFEGEYGWCCSVVVISFPPNNPTNCGGSAALLSPDG